MPRPLLKISSAKLLRFRKTVYAYFKLHGRDLPWRKAPDPYAVFVSEIMLQQTQVDRVAPIFTAFMKALPDFRALARAPLRNVLLLWQGLGYNRRAQHLKRAAEIVMREHGGILPPSPEVLETLPGIGKATAASIAAFGFNVPTVFLETNIRTALIHHFFSDRNDVSDMELLPIADAVLDRKNPAKWYSAIMDYGTMLKKKHGNASRRSAHYTKQSKFEGSRRQVRGRIVKILITKGGLSLLSISGLLKADQPLVQSVTGDLMKEKLVIKRGNRYFLGS